MAVQVRSDRFLFSADLQVWKFFIIQTFVFKKNGYGIISAKFAAKYSIHRFVTFNKRFNSESEMPTKVHDDDFKNGATHSI